MIDLDSNATTRLLPEVLESMLPWLTDGYANPSGSYDAAKQARTAIEQAREQVAALIGASPDEIVFTSGGTESVNTALCSMHALTPDGALVCSAIEHSAVLRCVDSMEREKRLAPVTPDGRLDLNALPELLDGAAFLSLMTANNETGVIQPLKEAIDMAHQRGLPVHSDAIQAIGKIPFNIQQSAADFISLSAHKFHGPKGIGALYIRSGSKFRPLLQGGGQESGRRSGTENTAAIVGMGTAAAFAMSALTTNSHLSIAELRDAFENQIINQVSGVTANGSRSHRLPNTSHLSFDQCDAAGLIILLNEAGIQCSAGSACMTGKQKPSHVQLAMGIPEARAKSSLRFSLSKLNSPGDVLAAVNAVKTAVEKLRRIQGTGVGPVVIYSP